MGLQKTLNSENNLERQKHTWRYQNPRFQDVLQSSSKPISMGSDTKTDTQVDGTGQEAEK